MCISDYVTTGMYPENSWNLKEEHLLLIEKFIEQQGNDLSAGCLLVIFRIRSNLMHGLKDIDMLNDQLELFRAINGVLESIE